MNTSIQDTFARLQQEIFRMQGGKPTNDSSAGSVGLGPVLNAFSNHTFPVGTVHECITTSSATTAATTGFVARVLSRQMKNSGPCIWISTDNILFPPGFSSFGLPPDRILFVNAKKENEINWTSFQKVGR